MMSNARMGLARQHQACERYNDGRGPFEQIAGYAAGARCNRDINELAVVWRVIALCTGPAVCMLTMQRKPSS
jgi:hypothetical protein